MSAKKLAQFWPRGDDPESIRNALAKIDAELALARSGRTQTRVADLTLTREAVARLSANAQSRSMPRGPR